MASEKTEEPTPKKLRDARKKGEVPKSKDLQNAFVLLAVAGTLVGTGEASRRHLEDAIRLSIRSVEENVAGPRALEAVAALGMQAVLPILLAALVTGTAIGFLQVGGLLTFEPLQPKLERLDPIRGLKNLFSQKQLIELLKSLLKVGIIAYVAYGVLFDAVRGIAGLPARDPSAALHAAGAVIPSLLFRVGGAALAIGALDVLYQRWRYRQDQKMTKDEVKREYKDAEGDPHAKQSRERLHREILEH
ncbi:MAG: EscU/YscU/HrcU family type III secretion system export apparatus switch protein, partial [Myxococcales bacterium]|nr:EscU/YscU/HrcU family type III secretion system export apparatus switch protein [Myxococcales bacterium]